MSHRQWYAMKQRLQKEGKWKGASHKVPEREEGEPDPKVPREDDGDTDPEMPPLESPETVTPSPEGNMFYFSDDCIWIHWVYSPCMGESRISDA